MAPKSFDEQRILASHLPDLLGTTGIALAVFNAKCELIWADELFQDMFGSLDELLGRDCCEIHALPRRDRCPVKQTLLSGEPSSMRWRVSDGKQSDQVLAISTELIGADADGELMVLTSTMDLSSMFDPASMPRFDQAFSYITYDGHSLTLEMVAEHLLDAVVMIDEGSRVRYWNQAAEKLFLISRDKAIGASLPDLIMDEESRARHVAGFARYLQTGESQFIGQVNRVKALRIDGEELHLDLSISTLNRGGKVYAIGCMRDTSQLAEERLAAQESQLIVSEAQRIAQLGIWVSDYDEETSLLRSTSWTDELYQLLELEREHTAPSLEVYTAAVHPTDRQYFAMFHAAANLEDAWEINYRLQMPDGRDKHVVEASRVMQSKESARVRRIITLREITEFTMMEEQLADRSQQQEIVANIGLLALGEGDVYSKLQQIIDITADTLGAWAAEILESCDQGAALRSWVSTDPLMHATGLREPSLFERYVIDDKRVVVTSADDMSRFALSNLIRGREITAVIGVAIHTVDGVWGLIIFHSSTVHRSSPHIVHFVQAVANITAAVIENHAARERQRLSAEIFDTSQPIFITDAAGNILRANSAFCRLYQVDANELAGSSLRQFEEDGESVMHYFGSSDNWTAEVYHKADSRRFPVTLSVTGVRDDQNRLSHYIGHVTDLTVIRAKEKELQHAMRLDAIGQLSSGVAHDFNNLLGVIQGNLHFIQDDCSNDPDVQEMFEDAYSALHDGTDLTRRLLTFSHALPENARTIRVSEVLPDIERFLSRAISGDITISTVHEEGEACINVDVSALESAMLNLCINARDAMPKGGELLIKSEVRDFSLENDRGFIVPKPGEYVVISLQDTGTGIDEAQFELIFEPFYTTKRSGKGSGLGLSMVRNFLLASEGSVHIESVVNKGTTIYMLFPSVIDVVQETESSTSHESLPHGGLETILVVEDEPRLRRIVVRQLESLNYRVLEAENAALARRIIETGTRLDLVFSDVMMPGDMDGNDLGQWIRDNHPRISVLLMSGHSKTASSDRFPGIKDFVLLRKPYSKEQLAGTVRQVLDAR